MARNQIVRLLQPCYTETWHHQQLLSFGRAETGEEFTLFRTNGFRTVLKSIKEHEDEQKALNILGEYSREDEKAAQDRISRTDEPEGEEEREQLYGKLYEEVQSGT